MSSCGQLRDATYCFCDSDLCNSKPITRPVPTPIAKTEISTYGDDEDYDEVEGSGHGQLGDLSPEQKEDVQQINIQTTSDPTSSIDVSPATKELPPGITANSMYSGSTMMHSYLVLIVFSILSALPFQ